jgi:hypothetical protein
MVHPRFEEEETMSVSDLKWRLGWVALFSAFAGIFGLLAIGSLLGLPKVVSGWQITQVWFPVLLAFGSATIAADVASNLINDWSRRQVSIPEAPSAREEAPSGSGVAGPEGVLTRDNFMQVWVPIDTAYEIQDEGPWTEIVRNSIRGL